MKTIKIGNIEALCLTKAQVDKLPFNINKMSNIFAPNLLTNNSRYSKYINEHTMGALDNWASHEKINVFFTPLQDDLFNDLSVNMYKNGKKSGFIMDLPKTEMRTSVTDFLRELYINIVESSKNIK